MKASHIVIGLSWLISTALLVHLWRGRDPMLLKVGLSFVLLVPLFGPCAYLWIQAMPGGQHPDVQDQFLGGDVLGRWRNRLEAGGYLRPLRRWGDRERNFKRRRK
jgi:hypothetical protein